MKLYLAGPMSGIENHNYPAFAEAARVLRAKGHEVVSPAELHPDAANIEGKSTPEDYRKYLVRDFAAIAECDGLALMHGFEESKGALLEVHFALTLGLPCYQVYQGADEGLILLNGSTLKFFIRQSLFNIRIGVCGDVMDERAKQDRVWGEQNHTDIWWAAILGEEFGEVSQAILHDEFGGKAAGTVRTELVQLAAVALAWIECIDRRSA